MNKKAEQYWDELYTKRGQVWSGRVNAPLANVAEKLQPGSALDLGCGEGGDTVWLAQQGWQVTATDVSQVALARTKKLVTEHDVSNNVSLQHYDLEVSFPKGTYDLVSAQYLQSPIEFQRQQILQKAAHAVAPGGTLIIVEHGSAPSWSEHRDHHFPTAKETFDSLDLDVASWVIKMVDSPERETTSPDGNPATIKDNVIVAERRQ